MRYGNVEVHTQPRYSASLRSLDHYRDSIVEKLNRIRDLDPSSPNHKNLITLFRTGLIMTDDFELTASRFPDGTLYREATRARFARIHRLLRKADTASVVDWGFPAREVDVTHFLRSRAIHGKAYSWITGEPHQHLEFVKYSENVPSKRVESAKGLCSMKVKDGHFIILKRGNLEDSPADAFIVLVDTAGDPYEPYQHIEDGSNVYKSNMDTLLKTHDDKADYLRIVDESLQMADLGHIDSIALLAIGSVSIIDKVIQPFLLKSRNIHRVYLVTDKPKSWAKFNAFMGCDEPTLEQHVFRFLKKY